MGSLLELSAVRKTYDGKRYVLDGVDLRINQGDFATIIGPSGSGKSTILNIIGLLDRHTDGTLAFNGKRIRPARVNSYFRHRARDIGFVFQAYHLIETISVTENALVPFLYNGRRVTPAVRRELDALLERLQIAHVRNTKVSLLSGGERQRVAIARAVIKHPRLVIADEPTGNLDAENSALVLSAFEALVDQGSSVIMVTHDLNLAAAGRRVLRLEQGRLVEQDRLVEHDRLITRGGAG